MSFFGSLFGGPDAQTQFSLYAADDKTNTSPIITFDSLMTISYTNQVNIAYEPLEKGSFSSDSLQGTPFNLSVVGKVAPALSLTIRSNVDMRNQINKTIQALKTYLENTTILKIINARPLFDEFPSIKITSFNYNLTPDMTVLKCFMTFQEIRQTTTQDVKLPQSQVSEPTNSSVIDNGQQSAKVTTP
jgi:hypothetical protein